MRRWIAPLLALMLTLAVAILSSSAEAKNALHTHGELHTTMHIAAFAAVSFTAMLCSRRAPVRFLLVCCVLLLGWATEYREHLLDGWPIEQDDVLSNAIGTLVGSALGWLTSHLSRAR